jgi:WD40 repeat protein
MVTKQIKTNPYIAGNPIQDKRGFFGRRNIMKWVQDELGTAGSNVLVLRGQRRIGKTTLLLQLKHTLPDDKYLPVFFNLQAYATQEMKNVLSALADTMAKEAKLKPKGNKRTFLPKSQNNTKQFAQNFLPLFLEKISPRRPVILLDEFDVLDNQETANELFQYFATLITDFPDLAFVIATGRDPSDLSKDYSAIFKGAFSRDIWVLDRESAIELIRQAEENQTLNLPPESVERILTLTNRHPFLTQLICQRLWQMTHPGSMKKEDEIPVAKPGDIDIAAEDALMTGELQLAWFWNGLTAPEKVFIAALAEISDEGKSISENKVIEVLSRHADRFRSHEVEKIAPQYLVKRNILEQTAEGEYRFFIELIRRWVKNNRSLQTVKTELDQSNTQAEDLFKGGKAYYDQQKWVDAKMQFSNALEIYPNHFKSLTYLGETLIKLEEFEKSVDVLEKAYRIDPDEAQKSLARALTHYAQELFRKEDDEKALVSSERALQLFPQERNAKTLRTSIWNKRGDAFLQEKNFSEALDAFQKAGNAQKIQNIYESQKEEREKLRITLQINPELVVQKNTENIIRSLSFSPDNVILASGLDNGKIVFWGPSSGKRLRIFEAHSKPVNSIIYPPKGTILASGSDDGEIILWDADLGIQIDKLEGYASNVNCLAFSADGKILGAGGADKKIFLWDINTRQLINSLDGLSGTVMSMGFSPNGRFLSAGLEDGSIILWDIIDANHSKLVGHSNAVNSIAFTPDSTLFASGSSDSNIILWDLSGQQVASLVGHTDGVTNLKVSPDGSMLASGSNDSRIILWHLGGREQIIAIEAKSSVMSLAFSNTTGILLAASSDDKTLQLWKIKQL